MKSIDNGTAKTSEELILEILEGAKETMKSNLQEQIKKNIADHLSWTLREHLQKIASEFVTTEMTEDIKALLIEQKPLILEQLKGAFVKIAGQVAIAFYEQAAKNLAVNNYRTSEILKKIIE